MGGSNELDSCHRLLLFPLDDFGFKGLASYHFVDDTVTRSDGRNDLAAYISYEHERVAQWPPLDNGTPVPSRVWFSNTSFDSTTRTFRGTIDWEGTYNTTWQGDISWRYAQLWNYTWNMEHL